ncbi:MAG: efflux RND transporter periplasmic adaptor subunit [bacterium]
MRKISTAACTVLVGLALLPACGKGRKKEIPGPNDKVFKVSTAEVQSRDIPDGIDLPGTFTPSQRLLIKSDFTGKVQALAVIEGQQVAVGDALLKIEDEKLPYVLDRQRAELREAEAQLELDSKAAGATPEENAEATFEASMMEQPPIPNEENPENPPEANLAPGQATPEATENTPFPVTIPRPFPFRNQARKGILPVRPAPAPQQNPEASENRIGLDQAKIDRIKAEIALSEKQLAGSTILATVDGFVSKVNIAEGSSVKPDDPLLEIVKTNPIELTVAIPKSDVGRLNKSMDAKVSVTDLGQETLDGEISFIGAELDATKKTLELRVRVANPELRIKAGMEGIAHLAIANKTHPALLIPAAAIRSEGDKKYVYVVRGQVAERREVTLGGGAEGLIEIKKGLKAGERVVTRGLDELKDEEEFVKASS